MLEAMRRSILLLFATIALSGQEREIADVAAKLRQSIVKSQKKAVAILEVANPAYGPELSNYLVDELTTGLVDGAPGFKLLTRDRLEQIMRERNLKHAAGFDSAAYQKLGQLAGADAIVAGKYTVLSSSIRVNLQVYEISDGSVIASASTNLPKTPDMDKMLLPKAAPVEAPPAGGGGGGGVTGGPAKGFGPFRLDLRQNKAGNLKVYEHTLTAHGCERQGSKALCLFSWHRAAGSSPLDRDASIEGQGWHGKLVDPFGSMYPYKDGYFLTGRGQAQRVMNIAGDESRFVVEEFAELPTDVAKVKYIWNQLEIRDIPVR